MKNTVSEQPTSTSPPECPLFGVLNLQKPAGMTSRDVVNIVQRLVRPAKVGHAGTLDPMATGVLLVCIGPATRLVSILQQAPKIYRAEFRLGQTSDTDDSTGEVQTVESEPVLRDQIEAVLPEFTGIIEQTPPAWSAVKVDGRRAYALAREGNPAELTPRPVRIDSIQIESCQWPEMTVTIQCGSGTYIRSIARDLGRRLQCGGLMSGLERLAIGRFTVADAIDPDGLTGETVVEQLLPAVHVVDHISQYRCSPEERRLVARGGSFELCKMQLIRKQVIADRPGKADDVARTPPLALLSECGTELLALGEIRRQGRRIQPRTVFLRDE